MNAFIAGVIVAVVVLAVVFVVANRKHAGRLDDLEQKVRDFKPKK